MSDHPFYRLAPFIQEYIYAHQWTELRAVQVEACRVLFETGAHLLIATGTASGKTEAAFLPVLTLLHEKPSTTVGVLYIGPTKALINDQFFRLSDLLAEAKIPVWEWHGDVLQSHKTKLLKNPSGVLQITPESLESLLMNRRADLTRLFGDLRFIVLDEVHVFMGSDRGRQVLCQIARLTRFMREEPRRIGLSATLGDYSLAERWLASGSPRPVVTSSPPAPSGSQRMRLALEHFYVADASSAAKKKHGSAVTVQQPSTEESPPPDDTTSYLRYIFEQSKSRKCLIFANNRGATETVTALLRQIAEAEGFPDIYHVHHGSIAAPLREMAEEVMRDPNISAVIAATLTLELGIDIGQLERVIQLNAPYSVASFLQRLGRSGRRGSPSEMWFVCSEKPPSRHDDWPKQIPWNLLQAIAIIQLYVEERWIEPIQPIKYPLSLLYHQTMSILAGMGEMSPAALAQHVLTLPPFKHISQDDFRELLQHLIEIDHIQWTEERGLIIGLTGEKVVRNFHFYAVFTDNVEYVVSDETREIGSVAKPPPPGERFALAGRTWETIEVDHRRKTVFVKLVKGKAETSWDSGGGTIHTRVLERMRRVLLEDTVYGYLQPNAVKRLSEARQLTRSTGLSNGRIFPLGGISYCVLPWLGSIECQTLARCLEALATDSFHVTKIAGIPPYYLTMRLVKGDAQELHQAIGALAKEPIEPLDLIGTDEAPPPNKYDEFIPQDLLRKAFAADYLDVIGLQRAIAEW